MEEGSERRRFPRYHCTGAAEVLQSGKRWGWGKVTDISRVGCYIETDHPLLVGTEAQLRLMIADISLDIGVKVISSTPYFGTGLDFLAVTPELDNTLAQIIDKVSGIALSHSVVQAELPQINSETIQVTREAAPDILAKIIKQINENGVLTRQELLDIVKANK